LLECLHSKSIGEHTWNARTVSHCPMINEVMVSLFSQPQNRGTGSCESLDSFPSGNGLFVQSRMKINSGSCLKWSALRHYAIDFCLSFRDNLLCIFVNTSSPEPYWGIPESDNSRKAKHYLNAELSAVRVSQVGLGWAFRFGKFDFTFSWNALWVHQPGSIVDAVLLFLLAHWVWISQGSQVAEETIACIVFYPHQLFGLACHNSLLSLFRCCNLGPLRSPDESVQITEAILYTQP